MINSPNRTAHLRSLDLCRGLAAIAVLFYHMDFLLFGEQTLLKRGYLCVDFFFLLSGFVIANSYERRLGHSLEVFEFVVLRVARLWPLVALATVIGLLVQVPRWQRDLGAIDPWAVVLTGLFNGVGLPTPLSPNQFLFPLNGAAWSIFFEAVVNLAYVLLLPWLSRRILLAIVVVSGLALLLVGVWQNTIDVGWDHSNFLYGFPRASFAFFLGVIIWRIGAERLQTQSRNPRLLVAALLIILAAISVPTNRIPIVNGLYDVALVVIAFPVLLLIAIRTRLGPQASAIAWLLGGISYSVYLLQTPLVIGFSALPQVLLGRKIGQFVPWAGFVFIALILVVSYLTWTRFEQPAQRWLRDRMKRHQAKGATATLKGVDQ